MQIVIDLPEGEYELACKYPEVLFGSYGRAIANGTPLQKGHGRIIDEDQIPGDGGWDFSDRLASTQTIIEADKESEDK